MMIEVLAEKSLTKDKVFGWYVSNDLASHLMDADQIEFTLGLKLIHRTLELVAEGFKIFRYGSSSFKEGWFWTQPSFVLVFLGKADGIDLCLMWSGCWG